MLPKLLLDAWRHGKYISGLGERLGSISNSSADKPVIWIHCVSVGEVQAARPLVHALSREFPAHSIFVSTVTITGQAVAREVFKDVASQVFYFPIDWRWSVRRVLDSINPAMVLIMETELWPNFLRECRASSIPVAVVNGRLSEKSFSRYQLVPSFIARVINHLSLTLMQTEGDADRMRRLGLTPERVIVCGNVKFDAGEEDHSRSLTAELTKRFEFSSGRPVIVAASTHEPEERIIIESFKKLHQSEKSDVRLVIAPRHPERFSSVAALIQESGFSCVRRSAPPADLDRDADIVLFDSIGELRSLFPIASIVFVGGSLAPVGGHNILEPAAVGACIVTGPHTDNFDEIVRTFMSREAVIQLGFEENGAVPATLANVFTELLNDSHKRSQLGLRGKALIEENRGATSCIIEHLRDLLAT
jgi:3-deoxy-D-manno-octulosonic-acid transferase